MNLGRIFANAIARRVAYLVVAAFIAVIASMFGMGQARAQSGESIQQAYDRCKSGEADILSEPGWVIGTPCNKAPGSTDISGTWRFNYGRAGEGYNPNQYGSAFLYSRGCPAGQTWNDLIGMCSECPSGQESPTFPSNLGVYRCPTGQCAQYAVSCSASGPTPSHVCWSVIGGSKCTGNEPCPSGFRKDPNGNCYPIEECPEGTVKDEDGNCLPPASCPDGQSKDQFGLCKPNDNECPAGQIKSPEGSCMPGDGQCQSGHVRGADGTCKKDSDGDGKPDDEDGDGDDEDGQGEGDDKSTFSGGENCNAPPACAGDNIMCGQAKIQWRIDCNTRTNAVIAGGQCGSVPQCTGDGCKALDYAILVTTWRTACALEQGTSGPGGEGGVVDYLTAEREGERAALQGIANEGDGLEGVEEGSHWSSFETGTFDEGLFGGGGVAQCDFLGGPLQIMGRPIELPSELWSLFQWIGWITVASAYLWLAFKLGE